MLLLGIDAKIIAFKLNPTICFQDHLESTKAQINLVDGKLKQDAGGQEISVASVDMFLVGP